ncbi:subtilisin family serine protease [Microbacterium endophyticum]|uniref:Subtilisin family serine protease n=1 Tax=Microbacterium endophyticum TaxID=1526412 RepID=A0A7W4YMN9_9MICO|nr:S8 family serine peptidase [Microbacterium endophyticum]MBB2974861.1 subtilisin family serine protease [Microbacterium endophyticum]NIK37158.1 subtilisin family serine protease [Microbacterium endophyticum]
MRRPFLAAATGALVAALALILTAGAAVPATPNVDPVRQAEYWLDDYGVSAAWQTTRGVGTRIAIIDTGIGYAPEFDGAVVGGTDMSGLGSPDGRTPVGGADSNHGSWVASLAASRGLPDGTGMLGVAPQAELLSVSVGFGVESSVPFVTQVADGIRWAVDNGADVINMSFTTNTLDWDPSWDDAFLYAFDHDVVVVVAAGNRGAGTDQIGAPATIPGVLVVGGVDPEGNASQEASTQGVTIGVSAPSERLLGVSADGNVVLWNGTSGAAPIVSAVAALVRSANPGMSAADVINHIVSTATPAAAATSVPDVLYGYGLVNAEAAVTTWLPSVTENPMGSLSEWIRLYRRADAGSDPEPSANPVTIAPLEPPEEAINDASALIPTAASLTYGTLPLVAVTVPAILGALGVTAAVRRIRSARHSRTPTR